MQRPLKARRDPPYGEGSERTRLIGSTYGLEEKKEESDVKQKRKVTAKMPQGVRGMCADTLHLLTALWSRKKRVNKPS